MRYEVQYGTLVVEVLVVGTLSLRSRKSVELL